MKYKAIKRVKFDRPYLAEEIIADGVIDPRKIKSLMAWGLIAPVADSEEVEPVEEKAPEEVPAEAPGEVKKPVKYSSSALNLMNKDQLVKLGREWGLPVDETMTKVTIISAIENYQDAE